MRRIWLPDARQVFLVTGQMENTTRLKALLACAAKESVSASDLYLAATSLSPLTRHSMTLPYELSFHKGEPRESSLGGPKIVQRHPAASSSHPFFYVTKRAMIMLRLEFLSSR